MFVALQVMSVTALVEAVLSVTAFLAVVFPGAEGKVKV